MSFSTVEHISITDNEQELRIDKLLSMRFPEYSRSYFQMLIENGHVTIDGKPLKKRDRFLSSNRIEITFVLPEQISLSPEEIPLDIVYEDEFLIIVNKPAGLVVHPGPGHPNHTFVNGLLFHCKTLPLSDCLRPGIVHRLDKDTSGLLMAAKTQEAHIQLTALFAKRQIQKEYLAICLGNPKKQTIESPIARNTIHRQEMTVDEDGKEAITHLVPLASTTSFSLVRLFPKTGRTHQLRVHLKSIGHPIVGDSLYGNIQTNGRLDVKRQLLHAESLTFTHPFYNKEMTFKALIPDDFNSFLDANFKQLNRL